VHKQEIAQSISAQLNKGIFKNLNLIQSIIFTDRISTGGNALISVDLFPLLTINRVTFHLDILHLYVSWP